MRINYSEITIKKKVILESGVLDIEENNINVIIGPNGRGKTLLLAKLHLGPLFESTLVSQKNNELIAKLNTIDNITLTVECDEIINKVKALLEKFNLAYLLDLSRAKLSGGEKRIISLVRGLLSDAPFVLIDEPTNDLDYKKVNLLLEIIKEFSKYKTFIIVTHDERVKNIANYTFEIHNKRIEKKVNEINISTPIKEKKINKNKNKIEKIFLPNLFLLFSVFVCFLMFFFIIQDANNDYFSLIEPMPENQIDIFSPLTIHHNKVASAIPVQLLDFINSMDGLPSRSEIDDLIESLINTPLTFNLELLEHEYFDVIPIEYWRANDREFFLPGNYYIEYYHDGMFGIVDIDTSQYFEGDWRFNYPGEYTYPLNLNHYFAIIDNLFANYHSNETPLHLTYAVIVLNDEVTGFFDFLSLPASEVILSGNYLIRSNEIIEILNQIYVFESMEIMINHKLAIALAFISSNLLFTMSYLKLNNKNFVILRNYGFDIKLLKTKFNRQFNSYIHNSILQIIIIPIGLSFVQGSQIQGYFSSYLFIFFMSISLFLINFISRFLFYNHLKKIFHYSFRG